MGLKPLRTDVSFEEGAVSIVGGYKLLSVIAEGGFGTTYLAEYSVALEGRVVSKKKVCIKECSKISPQYEEILIAEAEAFGDLRHSGIPVMHNFVRFKRGSLGIVMSYIPGPTLQQYVKQKGPLDPEPVCVVAQRVLNILLYMHDHDVVHGDVKPQNLILQDEGHTVTLVDYGLSMVRPMADSRGRGFTRIYSPPEEQRGETLVPESDIYALGMTLIYALTGDVEAVKRKEVLATTPGPLKDFIQRLVVYDVLSRPSWEKENLFETIKIVRDQVFERRFSRVKSGPGLI